MTPPSSLAIIVPAPITPPNTIATQASYTSSEPLAYYQSSAQAGSPAY
jgi:hypothetical protein